MSGRRVWSVIILVLGCVAFGVMVSLSYEIRATWLKLLVAAVVGGVLGWSLSAWLSMHRDGDSPR